MVKKEEGITLMVLSITIMVMIILAGTVVYQNNIVDKAKFQTVVTNMQLIQMKVSVISEKVAFEGSQSKEKYYVGLQLKNQANKTEIAGNSLTSEQLEDENYYIYNKETLVGQGLEGIVLAKDEVYIVNYDTLDIIYPKGVTGLDGNIKYKLSEME